MGWSQGRGDGRRAVGVGGGGDRARVSLGCRTCIAYRASTDVWEGPSHAGSRLTMLSPAFFAPHSILSILHVLHDLS